MLRCLETLEGSKCGLCRMGLVAGDLCVRHNLLRRVVEET